MTTHRHITDDAVCDTVHAIIEEGNVGVNVGREGIVIDSISWDDDRGDYIYLKLDNGQEFKVEITEVYR